MSKLSDGNCSGARMGSELTSVAVRAGVEAAFEYANASLALEGLVLTEVQEARQLEVINGTLTIEEAIAQAIAARTGGPK